MNPYWERLGAALTDTSGIIVPEGKDEPAYFEDLRTHLRQCAASPELISAVVEEPGFVGRKIGDSFSGYLLATADYHWLVFEPIEEQFYCFWGANTNALGAYGVCGNPLYCWWE